MLNIEKALKKCADCDIDLVAGEPTKEIVEEAKEAAKEKEIVLEKLVHTNNDIELSYITSMLETEGIAYRISGSNNAIGYLEMKKGSLRVPERDIYVDSSRMNEAMAIVLSIAGEIEEDK